MESANACISSIKQAADTALCAHKIQCNKWRWFAMKQKTCTRLLFTFFKFANCFATFKKERKICKNLNQPLTSQEYWHIWVPTCPTTIKECKMFSRIKLQLDSKFSVHEETVAISQRLNCSVKSIVITSCWIQVNHCNKQDNLISWVYALAATMDII